MRTADPSKSSISPIQMSPIIEDIAASLSLKEALRALSGLASSLGRGGTYLLDCKRNFSNPLEPHNRANSNATTDSLRITLNIENSMWDRNTLYSTINTTNQLQH